MNKPTIDFDMRYHPYSVYTEKDQTELVIQWPMGLYSHYILAEDGSITNQYHQLATAPFPNREENYYWQDYTDIECIRQIYVLVTKHNYEVIVKSLQYMAQYFYLDETSYEDFSMDHANQISDASDAMKQLYLATEDASLNTIKEHFDEICQKYFYSNLMQDSYTEWTQEDKIILKNEFTKVADLFAQYSNQ